MTYRTRFCPRTFRDTPYVGYDDRRRQHWCPDCCWIRVRRRVRFWWSERTAR